MEKNNFSLPENAQRELKPGEEYTPILKPEGVFKEVTPYSVCMGILMVILFSAAAAYLGLKAVRICVCFFVAVAYCTKFYTI